jgi:hypothetical protein
MPAVEQIITAVLVAYVHVIGVVPVVGPVSWPGIDHTEPVAAILKPWGTANNEEGEAANSEVMSGSEVSTVSRFRYPIAGIPAALMPIAVICLPVSGTVILPSALPILRLHMLRTGPLITHSAGFPVVVLSRLLLFMLPRLIVRLSRLLLFSTSLRLIGMLLWLLLATLLLWAALLMGAFPLRMLILLVALVLLPGKCRTRDAKKNEQDSRTADVNCLHG